MKIFLRSLTCTLTCTFLTLGAHASDEARSSSAAPSPAAAASGANLHASPPFAAIVNGKIISAGEFDTAINEAARQKFYHAKPPEDAVDQLVRDVAEGMIDRMLLLEEIKRRGVKPNAQVIDDKIAAYEKRYAANPRWQQEREKILPPLRERLEDDDALAALEAKTRNIPPPSEEKVVGYYKKHPEKFTEPEKLRLSMILVTVDPSSPSSAWQAAEAEVGSLRIQILEGGADFADLARKRSNHESASMGGDLGYLHRGMLPEGIQDKIDSMKPGDMSPPTRILQGIALFRYESRQEPKHHEFATVKARASDLLTRDLAEEAWRKLREQLRKKAKIEINTQRYPALAQLSSPGK
ncbi:MAG TPA: peptidylprolyl isomerase [Aromatoleum sp.]|uniref:peptidylprolyl isomerase n=1 Tax=Aromatoleum sp. TaxID=2307007 RepID=UPI002B484D34|nr:peptidylprolyl isomerase [Aromatoleum sp.]HJV25455.1 peptidylprolyl isomerase [Aromatoleum sp.]